MPYGTRARGWFALYAQLKKEKQDEDADADADADDKGLEMTNSSWLGRRENSWQDSDQGKARRYALLKPSSSGHRETHSLGRWRS